MRVEPWILGRNYYFTARMAIRDVKLLRSIRSHRNLKESFEALKHSCGLFGISQLESEIEQLTALPEVRQAQTLLEIGTASAGTTFLLQQFARPKATVITIDVTKCLRWRLLLPMTKQRGQRMHVIQADSRSSATRVSVEKILAARTLDVLFIDGDHTYDGVRADFENFSDLVSPGGIIVFHDIVPDYQTRYGRRTKSYSGDVPVFWNEIKHAHTTAEFIEDPDQDGFGIGVIFR